MRLKVIRLEEQLSKHNLIASMAIISYQTDSVYLSEGIQTRDYLTQNCTVRGFMYRQNLIRTSVDRR